jgi:hypothetical protein
MKNEELILLDGIYSIYASIHKDEKEYGLLEIKKNKTLILFFALGFGKLVIGGSRPLRAGDIITATFTDDKEKEFIDRGNLIVCKQDYI